MRRAENVGGQGGQGTRTRYFQTTIGADKTTHVTTATAKQLNRANHISLSTSSVVVLSSDWRVT